MIIERAQVHQLSRAMGHAFHEPFNELMRVTKDADAMGYAARVAHDVAWGGLSGLPTQAEVLGYSDVSFSRHCRFRGRATLLPPLRRKRRRACAAH